MQKRHVVLDARDLRRLVPQHSRRARSCEALARELAGYGAPKAKWQGADLARPRARGDGAAARRHGAEGVQDAARPHRTRVPDAGAAVSTSSTSPPEVHDLAPDELPRGGALLRVLVPVRAGLPRRDRATATGPGRRSAPMPPAERDRLITRALQLLRRRDRRARGRERPDRDRAEPAHEGVPVDPGRGRGTPPRGAAAPAARARRGRSRGRDRAAREPRAAALQAPPARAGRGHATGRRRSSRRT